eukprot:gene11297-3334_t
MAQSIMEYNGSAIVAMTGKECVAIAADRRLGVQAQTVSTNFQKMFQMSPKVIIGLPGLATDVITVANRLKFRLKLYNLREERDMEPKTMTNLISSFLYEKRFGPYFVEPIVAGLDSKNNPYVASTDLIGCPMETNDFVVGGTSSDQLFGMCESLYKPDMLYQSDLVIAMLSLDITFVSVDIWGWSYVFGSPDELFEAISQALLNAVDRDCLAGWGAVVHIIEKDKITTRELKARMD